MNRNENQSEINREEIYQELRNWLSEMQVKQEEFNSVPRNPLLSKAVNWTMNKISHHAENWLQSN